ncbi:hypothetical protein C8J57DRAFT_1538306 [Mycena rebaudengoi]|nr:hypothetical protein C8J57DRAFT_1538306 [Mycena rebaudengoi]
MADNSQCGVSVATTGTGGFQSALSQPATVGSEPGDGNAPDPPQQKLYVEVDSDGVHYLWDRSTGARFDVQDDPDISLRTPFYRSPSGSQGKDMELTPSETSDLKYSSKESTTKDPPSENS